MVCDKIVEATMTRKPLGRSASDELTFSQRLEIVVSIFNYQPLRRFWTSSPRRSLYRRTIFVG
jgi:hypothetical protein